VQTGQHGPAQQQQQLVQQYLDAELAVMTHYTQRIEAGGSKQLGLLQVLQEMSSIALGLLAGPAGGAARCSAAAGAAAAAVPGCPHDGEEVLL
jgi:hypothetical protein